jgi:16S rRNA (uracil1498-N3)-methyltransferase
MRQYVCELSPDKNGCIEISGKDFKYLTQVLRLKAGSILDVRLSDNSIKPMQVCELKQKSVVLELCSQNNNTETGVTALELSKNTDAASPQIWIMQFLPKSSVMDDVVRHAVECGAYAVLPVIGEYSKEGVNSQAKVERWQRIVKEARQQCGSQVNTKIYNPMKLDEAVKEWKQVLEKQNEAEDAKAYLLHEMPQKEQKGVFALKKKYTVVCLAVGTEGGISETELQKLLQNGFEVLHFNTNVMRVDTACLYGLAVIQHALTEFSSWHAQE